MKRIIVFNFMEDDRDAERLGLVFLQMYRRMDGRIHAEMRRFTTKGPEMYAIETEDVCVADFLDEIIVTNEIPDLKEWDRMDIDEEA